MTFVVWETGAQAIIHTEVCKKPYQLESTTQGPFDKLSNDFDAAPSTKSHMRNERQTNQEASVSCNMPSGTVTLLTVICSIRFIDVYKIIGMHGIFCTWLQCLFFLFFGLLLFTMLNVPSVLMKGPKSIDCFSPQLYI